MSLQTLSARPLAVMALLISATIMLRLGYLRYEVIDWDESTFILTAWSVSQGYLPYVEVWDLKPPMFFFALGAVLKLFGQSLLYVRLFGAVLVALTACLIYLTAKRILDARSAIFAGGTFVLASTPWPLQHSMTEHLAMAFLMLAVLLLLRKNNTAAQYFIIGILISLATLTRSNLAFVAIGIGFGILLFENHATWRGRLARFSTYVLGGCIPLGIILMLYHAAGHLDLFLIANLDLPLAYASEQRGFFLNLAMIIGAIFAASLVFPDLWGAMIALPVTRLWQMRRNFTMLDLPKAIKWLILVAGLILVSMASSGFFTWHHLYQLIPFLALLCAGFIPNPLAYWQKILVLCMILVALARSLPHSAIIIFDGLHHPLYKLSQQIEKDRQDDDVIFALAGQLLYWYIQQPPPLLHGAHPSNLFKPALENIMIEKGLIAVNSFEQLIDSRPRYILLPKTQNWHLKSERAIQLQPILETEYEIWQTTPDVIVMRRLAPRP